MRLDGRRWFLVGVGALLAALRVSAQKQRARIGFLATVGRAASAANRQAFFAALKEKGWNEGESPTVDRRFAEGILERHDVLARALIALNPQLIFAPTQ